MRLRIAVMLYLMAFALLFAKSERTADTNFAVSAGKDMFEGMNSDSLIPALG